MKLILFFISIVLVQGCIFGDEETISTELPAPEVTYEGQPVDLNTVKLLRDEPIVLEMPGASEVAVRGAMSQYINGKLKLTATTADVVIEYRTDEGQYTWRTKSVDQAKLNIIHACEGTPVYQVGQEITFYMSLTHDQANVLGPIPEYKSTSAGLAIEDRVTQKGRLLLLAATGRPEFGSFYHGTEKLEVLTLDKGELSQIDVEALDDERFALTLRQGEGTWCHRPDNLIVRGCEANWTTPDGNTNQHIIEKVSGDCTIEDNDGNVLASF